MDLPNPNRIDLDDRAQVMLWADLLAISAERLIEIAGKVGPMSAAIRCYAAKLGDERRPAAASGSRSIDTARAESPRPESTLPTSQRQPQLRDQATLAARQADVAAVRAGVRAAHRSSEDAAPVRSRTVRSEDYRFVPAVPRD